jgi:hypothetical protein
MKNERQKQIKISNECCARMNTERLLKINLKYFLNYL